MIKETDFTKLVEQNIVPKDSIEPYEAEVWKDLIIILLVISESFYYITFGNSSSAGQNFELYKDFRHLSFNEMIKHLVKEHKIDDDVDIQFGVELKKFYDNRDIFTNS